MNYHKLINGLLVYFILINLFQICFLKERLFAQGEVDKATFNLIKPQGGDAFTGDLDLTIPLLVVPGVDGLDFPISINYHHDTRPEREATWVGRDWSLQIGSITRSVVNIPDEQKMTMFTQPSSNVNIAGTIHDATMLEEDGSLSMGGGDYFDDYYLNSVEGTDKLIPTITLFGEQHGIVYNTKNWKGWDVAFTGDGWNGGGHTPSYFWNNIDHMNDFIQSWKVTREDGKVFLYDHRNILDMVNGYHSAGSDQFHLINYLNYSFPVSWDLTCVYSPNYGDYNDNGVPDQGDIGGWVKINYNDYANKTYNSSAQRMGGGQAFSNVKLSRQERGSAFISGIIGTNSGYNYSCFLKYDYSNVGSIETPTHIAYFDVSTRSDFGTKKLDKIRLVRKNGSALILIKEIEFSYTYENVPGIGGLPATTRLVLTKIQQKNNSKALPPFMFEDVTADAWKITYPEGGSVTYEFEDDVFSWYWTNYRDRLGQPDGSQYAQDFTCYYFGTPRNGTDAIINYASGSPIYVDKSRRIKQKTVEDAIGNSSIFTYNYGDGVLSSPTISDQEQLFANALSYWHNGSVGYRWVEVVNPDNSKRRTYFTSGISTSFSLYQDGPSPPIGSEPVTEECYPSVGVWTSYIKILDNSGLSGYPWKTITYTNDISIPIKTVKNIYPEYVAIAPNELVGTDAQLQEKYSLDITYRYLHDDRFSSDREGVYPFESGWNLLFSRKGLLNVSKIFWFPILRSEQVLDNVSTSVEYKYNMENGLPMLTTEERNKQGQSEKKITKEIYAYEMREILPLEEDSYLYMYINHMLSQKFATLIYKDTETPSNIVFAEKNTWKKYSSVVMSYAKSIWPGIGLLSDYLYDIDDWLYPDPWVNGTEYNVHMYDKSGNIISDGNALINTSYLYNKNSQMMGKVVNAVAVYQHDPVIMDAFVDNFDDGSISDSDPFTWITSGTGYFGTDINHFTNEPLGYLEASCAQGQYAYAQIIENPIMPQAFSMDFQVIIEDEQSIDEKIMVNFSCSSNIFNSTGYTLIYHYNGTIEIKDNSTNSIVASTSNSKVPNVWTSVSLKVRDNVIYVLIDGEEKIQYEATNTLPTGYFIFGVPEGYAKFDNFRIYPFESQITTYSYDFKTGDMIAEYDNNYYPRFFHYDNLHRLISVTDRFNNIIQSYTYSYSRENSSSTFNASTPNLISEAQFTKGNLLPNNWGFEDGLNGDSPSYWEGSGQTNELTNDSYFGRQAIKIYHGGSNSSIQQFVGILKAGHTYTASVWFKAGAMINGQLFFGDVGDPDGNNNYQNAVSVAVTGNNGWQRMSVTRTMSHDDDMWVFLYGYRDGGVTGDFVIYDNVVVEESAQPTSPQLTSAYFDGLGRNIQSHNSLGVNNSITNISYDIMGRLSKTYKPYQTANRMYDQNFVTNANNTYPETNGYPYSENVYFTDALERIQKQGSPGLNFAVGSGHEIAYDYGSNQTDEVTGYNANTLYKTRVKDENGNFVETYTDNFGNVVANKVDPEGLNLVTTFRYDVMGNLIESTDPNGLTTSYSYNLKQLLIQKTSPDAGTVEYIYDQAKNLRFQQDAKQKLENKYTYWKYDKFSRAIEVGECLESGFYTFENLKIDEKWVTTGDINIDFPLISSSYSKTIAIRKYYDFNCFPLDPNLRSARNLNGKLFNVKTFTLGTEDNVYYSYDEYGRVEWELHRITGNHEIKLVYEYDLHGKMTKYSYLDLDAGINNTYFFYEYDAAGRLTTVYSSGNPNGSSKIKEVEYTYLPNGKVKRMVLGISQGVDYTYNERDWLRGINNLDLSQSPEDDAANLPMDRFGMKIGYHTLDEIATVQYATPHFNGNISWIAYNMDSAGYPGETNVTSLVGFTYGYDNANRLKYADFGYKTDSWRNANSYDERNYIYDGAGNFLSLKRFGYGISDFIPQAITLASRNSSNAVETYKADNIDAGTAYVLQQGYVDNFEAGAQVRLKHGFRAERGSKMVIKVTSSNGTNNGIMDYFTYNYLPGTNKLDYVKDVIPGVRYTFDMDDQLSGNYNYDANGNMIQDLQNGITNIIYDYRNLPIEMTQNGATTYYRYDANGNRVFKSIGTGGEGTYYLNDITGKTISVTDPGNSVKLNLYGLDHIGFTNIGYQSVYIPPDPNCGGGGGGGEGQQTQQTPCEGYYITNRIDGTYYYLKDHLGTIKMTVSAGGGVVVGYDDYSPFGMLLANRSANYGLNNARYKFLGKERDVETGYDYFGARYYDTRIGRFLSCDPLFDKGELRSWSPYHYSFNNPMRFRDPNGMYPGDPYENDEELRRNANVNLIQGGQQREQGIKQIAQAIDISLKFGPSGSAGFALGKKGQEVVKLEGTIGLTTEISTNLEGTLTGTTTGATSGTIKIPGLINITGGAEGSVVSSNGETTMTAGLKGEAELGNSSVDQSGVMKVSGNLGYLGGGVSANLPQLYSGVKDVLQGSTRAAVGWIQSKAMAFRNWIGF